MAETGRSQVAGRALAMLAVVALVAAIAAGFAGYRAQTDVTAGEIVAVELASDVDMGRRLVCGAPPAAGCPAAGDYLGAIEADWVLVAAYAVGLGGLCLLGALLFRARRSRAGARWAAVGAVVAAVMDAAENLLLHEAVDGLRGGGGGGAWAWAPAAAAATLKFAVLLPVLVVALTAVVVVPARALSPAGDFGWLAAAGRRRTVLPPPPVVTPDGTSWPTSGGATPTPRDLGRHEAEVGICVSGGGIRSASVSLGALQSLRSAGVLGKARYLVSVSGGGYFTGALRLAVQPHPRDDKGRPVESERDPAKVFAANSPELDHLRRHGRYIADSPGEWLVALVVVLRGVLVSLGLLAGLVTIVGMALGRFYATVPLADLDLPLPQPPAPVPAGQAAPQEPPAPGFPTLAHGAVLALGVVGALSLALWFGNVLVRTWRGRPSALVGRAATGLFALAGLVAALVLVVPAIVWLHVRGVWWLDGDNSVTASSAVASGAAGTVLLAYAGALISILWRHREKVGSVRKLFGSTSGVQRRGGAGLVQRVVVWVVLGALALISLVLLSAVILVCLRGDGLAGYTFWRHDGLRWWPHWYLVLAPVAFALVAFLVDQTWLSLHPFYRRRLATAFAVRRVRLRNGASAARAYDFDAERTDLSVYAKPVPGQPQLIFAGAAHFSGPDRTPPGRRAASFTFSHDWVGGPQVGYVRTGALERNAGKHLASDLTVQSAMAISGAAFASAMGRQSRAFQTLFALSNARLGTWLPNPGWLAERPLTRDWTQPRLPRVRRVTYLLREVLGMYDADDRLLLVTDGGHYDNLGLVELLRHRCRLVYCIDASGDAPPLTGTLAESIALAREELGVEVVLDDPLALVPGGGQPLDPKDPLATLSARLSRAAVVTGTVRYPEEFRLDGERKPSALGRIVVAKTRLTRDMPYDVLTYAAAHDHFPYDSTGDQWFDHGQFNAYSELGRYLGTAAAAAQQPRRSWWQCGDH